VTTIASTGALKSPFLKITVLFLKPLHLCRGV
jgi:hypothetical protein